MMNANNNKTQSLKNNTGNNKNVAQALNQYFDADNNTEEEDEEEDEEDESEPKSEGVGYKDNYSANNKLKITSPNRSDGDTSCTKSVPNTQNSTLKQNFFKIDKIRKNDNLSKISSQKENHNSLLSHKSSRKQSNMSENKDDKLCRNRVSAKKSRQKKKAYINSLESRYIKLEAELKQAKKNRRRRKKFNKFKNQ